MTSCPKMCTKNFLALFKKKKQLVKTSISISRSINKQIIVYSNNGKPFCNKNTTISDTGNDKDNSQKYYNEQ